MGILRATTGLSNHFASDAECDKAEWPLRGGTTKDRTWLAPDVPVENMPLSSMAGPGRIPTDGAASCLYSHQVLPGNPGMRKSSREQLRRGGKGTVFRSPLGSGLSRGQRLRPSAPSGSGPIAEASELHPGRPSALPSSSRPLQRESWPGTAGEDSLQLQVELRSFVLRHEATNRILKLHFCDLKPGSST